MYGIVQGGSDTSLRRESAQFISALPFNGIGIGGAHVIPADPGRMTARHRQQVLAARQLDQFRAVVPVLPPDPNAVGWWSRSPTWTRGGDPSARRRARRKAVRGPSPDATVTRGAAPRFAEDRTPPPRACSRPTSKATSSTRSGRARSRPPACACRPAWRETPGAAGRPAASPTTATTSSRKSRAPRPTSASSRWRRSSPARSTWSGSWWPRAIGSRSATRAPRSTRRRRRWTPAPARRRISSTACPRSAIASPGWPAPRSATTTSPPRSSATASTCTPRSCDSPSRPKGRRGSWPSPTARPARASIRARGRRSAAAR